MRILTDTMNVEQSFLFIVLFVMCGLGKKFQRENTAIPAVLLGQIFREAESLLEFKTSCHLGLDSDTVIWIGHEQNNVHDEPSNLEFFGYRPRPRPVQKSGNTFRHLAFDGTCVELNIQNVIHGSEQHVLNLATQRRQDNAHAVLSQKIEQWCEI